LGLVAAPELAGKATEEDAAIEMRTVGKDVKLQAEIIPLAFGLNVAVAVLDSQLAFFIDAELRLVAGNHFPAGQIFAVEDRFQAKRLEFDIGKSQGLPRGNLKPKR